MNSFSENLSSALMKLSDNLLKRYTIAEFEVLPTSLVRIGGYNAKPFSLSLGILEPLRASEIKGIWRWWLRAVFSAVWAGQEYYDKLDREVSVLLGSSELPSPIAIHVVYNDELNEIAAQLKEHLQKIEKSILNDISKISDVINNVCSAAPLPCEVTLHFSVRGPYIAIKRTNPQLARLLFNKLKSLNQQLASINILNFVESERGNEFRFTLSLPQLKVLELKVLGEIPRLFLLTMPVSERGEQSKITLWPLQGDPITPQFTTYLTKLLEEYASILLVKQHSKALSARIRVLAIQKPSDRWGYALNVLLSTFVMALIFSGIGSVINRGFGSLTIRRVFIPSEVEQLLDPRLKHLIECFPKNVNERSLSALTCIAVDYAAKYLNKDSAPQITSIPNVPTVDKNFKYFRLNVIPCRGLNFLQVLSVIGNSTLKQTWKRLASRGVKSSGKDLHTWILGLPRKVGDTGYIDCDRRSSSIGFSILSGEGSTLVIMYGFLSKDWPVDSLVHVSKLKRKRMLVRKDVVSLDIHDPLTKRRVKFAEGGIQEVFDVAYRTILDYISRRCGKGGVSASR